MLERRNQMHRVQRPNGPKILTNERMGFERIHVWQMLLQENLRALSRRARQGKFGQEIELTNFCTCLRTGSSKTQNRSLRLFPQEI